MTSTAGWTSVRISPSTRDGARDRALAALFAVGAQGVHEDATDLVTHFPPESDLDGIRTTLLQADDAATVQMSPVDDIDWSEAWKSRIHAQELGELAIVPPWLAEGRDRSRTIVIEPGMAFGTGEHPTTRGVVRLLQAADRRGAVVADLGAGSAVLAIAAVKRGAARAYAIELDPDAIPDAESNVERNDVVGRVHVLEGDADVLLPLVAPVDLILANIISSVLVELLPVMAAGLTTAGTAILSGILREEREAMVHVLTGAGWQVTQEDTEDIWWSASIARA